MFFPPVVFIGGSSDYVPLVYRSEAADIMLPPSTDDLVTLDDKISVLFLHHGRGE